MAKGWIGRRTEDFHESKIEVLMNRSLNCDLNL